MMRFKLPAAVVALAVCLGLSTQARADLIISVNGTQVASDPANMFASFTGSVNGFNINNITMAGVAAFGGNGMLVDNGSLNISTSGTGSLTILLTETDLVLGDLAKFSGLFTGIISNANVTRAFYVDPTNSGLLTDFLGSTSGGGGSFETTLSLSGAFSLTEQIVIATTGVGAMLSSDDSVNVPEPASIAVIGFGLAAIGMVRRHRKA